MAHSRAAGSAALHTPTDLSADATSAVTEVLNPLVADAFALYVKTKNFHWHVTGPHFRDYHLLLDEQGDQIFAMTDMLAERVRKIGGNTLRSIGHITKLKRIVDNDDGGQQVVHRQHARSARRRVAPQRRGDDEPTRSFYRRDREAHLVSV